MDTMPSLVPVLRSLFVAALLVLNQFASADNSTVSLPLFGIGKPVYFANISIGTPPQYQVVQVDTGSSDLWISAPGTAFCKGGLCQPGAFGSYDVNSSSTAQIVSKGTFVTEYGTGGIIRGDYVADNVVIGGATLTNFTFGVANKIAAGNIPILGLGPDSLETLAVLTGVERAGVLDAMVSAGAINRRAFSLYLGDHHNASGEVLFGGVDSSKYEGELTQMPIAKNGTGQYDRYRVDLSTVSFTDSAGNKTLSPPGSAIPIVLDSGYETLGLPEVIENAIVNGLGAVLSTQTGIYEAPCALRKDNGSLTFQLGGTSGPTYNMTLSELIEAQTQKVTFADGTKACPIYMNPASEADAAAEGVGGYVLGAPFLQTVYAVYDLDSWTISLAKAQINASPGKSGSIVAMDANNGAQADSTATAMPTSLPIPSSGGSGSATASAASGGGSGSAMATGSAGTGSMVIPTSAPSPTFGLATTAMGGATAAAATSSSSSSGALPTAETGSSLKMLSLAFFMFAGGFCLL